MSYRQIFEFASSGKERMSPISLFAKTVLPAPMKVILLGELLISYASSYFRIFANCAAANGAASWSGLFFCLMRCR